MYYTNIRFIGNVSDAGREWGQEEKGTTEDEMAGWHHVSLSELRELVMDREAWCELNLKGLLLFLSSLTPVISMCVLSSVIVWILEIVFSKQRVQCT